MRVFLFLFTFVVLFAFYIGWDRIEWFGYSWMGVVEWNKSPSPLQSVYRLDLVDDGGLIFFSFVFFGYVLILDGVLWISGVEWDRWG